MQCLRELFPEALLIPYATPGVELAKVYFNAYKAHFATKEGYPTLVFLQNHGLVISGESADEVIEKTEDVLIKIEKYLSVDFGEYHSLTNIWKLFTHKIIWKVTDCNIVDIYEKNGIWQHAFCPDCVVFLGKKILELPDEFNVDNVKEFNACDGQPVMISHRGNLYLAADSVKKALEVQSVMSFSAQVMDMNREFESIILSDDEQNFLLNWDAEQYRKVMK